MTRKALVVAAAFCIAAPWALQAQSAHHVSTDGSDLNPGTAGRPFRTVQKGVSVALPGDTIRVHAGTYTGTVEIKRRHSGTRSQPVTLRSAGDGQVILRADLAPISCTPGAPTLYRTVRVLAGGDNWTIQGFTIVGGILVTGDDFRALTPHLRNRSLPGRGMNDPEAGVRLLESLGVDGADNIRIVGNKIRGRGIYAVAARYGDVLDNEVFDINCGTGPGIVLARFADGWTVRGNHVHHIASSENHWMSEGIRIVAASMYNLIEDNLVEDIADPGRGIATDVNAGWNVIRGNTVRRTMAGLSEQMGGWGNRWIRNTAEANRKTGFNVFGMDADSIAPTPRTPRYLIVRCNTITGNPVDLALGTVRAGTFAFNSVGQVFVGRNLERYWGEAENTWDGSPVPPSENPPFRAGACEDP